MYKKKLLFFKKRLLIYVHLCLKYTFSKKYILKIHRFIQIYLIAIIEIILSHQKNTALHPTQVIQLSLYL